MVYAAIETREGGHTCVVGGGKADFAEGFGGDGGEGGLLPRDRSITANEGRIFSIASEDERYDAIPFET